MGLDRDFLTMLQAPFVLERRIGEDLWGNDAYDDPEEHNAYIEPATVTFGTGDSGGRQEKKAVAETQMITDAIGIQLEDRVTFDSTAYIVTGVENVRGEFGEDLYQTVTVENQKRG